VALTADDIPNILNIAGSYELPFGKAKPFFSGSRMGSAILGGWTLTQNWNFQNGVPLLITGPCDGIQSEIGVCRPNFIRDPNKGAHSQNQWFNPSAFQAAFQTNPAILTAADPTIYNEWWQFGNMGLRNNGVRSPGFWNTDMSLTKDFHFHRAAVRHVPVGGLQCSESPESRHPEHTVVSTAKRRRVDGFGPSVRLPVRQNHQCPDRSARYAVHVEVYILTGAPRPLSHNYEAWAGTLGHP
jgi:hypothetical protein